MEKKAVWFENSDFVSGTDLAIDLWKNIAVKGQKYLEPNNHPKDFRVVSQVRVATRRPSLPFLRKKEKGKKEEMPPETACRPLDNLDIYACAQIWNEISCISLPSVVGLELFEYWHINVVSVY